jgi:phosphoribosylformimino-5-aminoimidazole carboxamide ribonucleotide (ProFAR) isomerase
MHQHRPPAEGAAASSSTNASSSSSSSSSATDSSCSPYYVVTDKWQTYTDFAVTAESLQQLAAYCDEFLVHGVEVEGRRCGILEDLVQCLGDWSPLPVTYAGGARCVLFLVLACMRTCAAAHFRHCAC